MTTSNRKRGAMPTLPATLRVAVYTRKSTDEGLDMEFNSLDAQRQAIEAYVESQRGHGWQVLPERYDDGGYSGATTDRPAFQRLLQDVAAARIDIVAVYKIDRLSRSQMDFLTTVGHFEKNGVTFVSVTQAFDTRTSMGRLVMNLLATFAQFEREMISERTRDKIAASRKKGIWCGGRPVLGFDPMNRRLVVNAAEADQVRGIFQLYLDVGSLLAVSEELARRGWRNKSWTNRDGKLVSGPAFDKHSVSRLLSNPAYLGKTRYRGELVGDHHEPIVELKVWDAVQAQLRQRARSGGTQGRNKYGSLLKGMVRCGVCGAAMTFLHTAKKNRRYFYYQCQRQQKQGAAACPGSRTSAGVLEAFVVEKVRAIGQDPALLHDTIAAARRDLKARAPELIAETRRLEQEQRRLGTERANLLTAIAQGGAAAPTLVQRLAEVDQEAGAAAERARAANAELVAIENQVLDDADLRRAMATFDPVWDQLFPKEKSRILRLLIEAVRFDGRANAVEIDFRPGGVRALAAGGGDRRTA